MSRVNVILLAGGRGRRFGGDTPKQFRLLAGEPVLVRAARCFAGTAGLTRIVVVVEPAEVGRSAGLLAPLGVPLEFADAGAERQHSVASGLARVEAGCEVVVVHDAARPLVGAAVIARCVAAAERDGAAVVAIPLADTLKRCREGRVIETVPREELWLAQTPQAFRAEVFRRAHAEAARDGVVATDDVALVERLGLPVTVVAGEAANRKITTVEDLAWAEAWIASGRPA